MEEEKIETKPGQTQDVPYDPKVESIHFPWSIAIIIGVLMLCIIACFIVVMILEH